ncbi:MAG: hypothetical protein AABW92_06005, partial [Nanoarchaeota archaeon]
MSVPREDIQIQVNHPLEYRVFDPWNEAIFEEAVVCLQASESRRVAGTFSLYGVNTKEGHIVVGISKQGQTD